MINSEHKFHIPVLGVGFSVDTPVKVSKYGISSVISLVDDTLMEKLRRHYSEKMNKPYEPISSKDYDSRASRITAYLNMMNRIVKEQFEALRNSAFSKGSEISKYFEMLPDFSSLKMKYNEMLSSRDECVIKKLQAWLRENICPGSIDVNIMSKLDNGRYTAEGQALPMEFNDAHAALRGFAQSELESAIIFSAGMNPKLYSYLENFEDFYPAGDGRMKKKIIIKVSDFRSALIQGKFLAKKGLWISEYRIESGLNCGGHAFASDGQLMGPILGEFKDKRDELFRSVREIYLEALKKKNITLDPSALEIDVTVQGGVGKSEEQNFLLRYFEVKSVGWGSPFLLVPEVMNVDENTLQKLSQAGEEDLYLSGISPLGVPFNSVRNNGKELERMERVKSGKAGSACPKKFLQSSKEFSDRPLCTASITFMNKKMKSLKEMGLSEEEYKKEFDKAAEKTCLCEGLGASALIVNGIETPKQSQAVAVCPGPNLAYFSKVTGLKEMVDHIYGRINLITHPSRPNMFVKELSLYVDYFFKKASESLKPYPQQTETFLKTFRTNLLEGIKYYKGMIPDITEETEKVRQKMREEIEKFEAKLLGFGI
ncbi:MAG: hypothetical protein HF309_18850 [Ignavibacteria bacterium]|jgi:hypothetical protein|nr:hypothetical protein [Ignavibacteria bacterium]MCU7501339.1 hypothetical protein [Ignavibacteria bacterium]MCU7520694.1 hypothetical protein [Ignavibacteria bacterium]MCU7526368.1 hypothetical protein [Ignavibacteria bacterium]